MSIEPSLDKHLRQLEELMTNPEIRQCPEELSRLLAADFREFGGSGRIFNKSQIIEALRNQPPVQLWLDEFQVMSLAPDVVLVTYRGNCRFPESDQVSHSLRSSVWKNQNGRWEVVFHQGTPSNQATKSENYLAEQSVGIETPSSQFDRLRSAREPASGSGRSLES